jgi:hypothetical protein
MRHDFASLAVPGGTTPGPVFESLSAVDLDWSRVQVMLTDERWVPEDSPRSNTRLLRERLLVDRAARRISCRSSSMRPIAEDRLALSARRWRRSCRSRSRCSAWGRTCTRPRSFRAPTGSRRRSRPMRRRHGAARPGRARAARDADRARARRRLREACRHPRAATSARRLSGRPSFPRPMPRSGRSGRTSRCTGRSDPMDWTKTEGGGRPPPPGDGSSTSSTRRGPGTSRSARAICSSTIRRRTSTGRPATS